MSDIDRELIAMCDCPEIQDRWEPKVGDRVFIKRHEVYGHIVQIEGNDIIHVTSDDGQTYWRNTHDELIYIPRIEEVLEWNTKIIEDMISMLAHRIDFQNPLAFLKGLLMVHMHLQHNKSWNGEKWV